MAMEPWFLYPPEANYRRLSGSSAGARAAAGTYYTMAAALIVEGQDQYANAKQLAEANIGAVGDGIGRVGLDQMRYSEELAMQARDAAVQLNSVANRADNTRAWRVPLAAIENNKLWQKTAIRQLPWNPAAPAILSSALAVYAGMWTINASTGTAFDVNAMRNSLPVQVKSPPMSVAYGTNVTVPKVDGATSLERADVNSLLRQITRPEQAGVPLTPPAPNTLAPEVQNALANSEYVAQQMTRPIDGLRGGGLGTGETMPYVGANPTQAYPRGGIPSLSTQTTRGATATAERGDVAAFNPTTTTGARPGVGTSLGTNAGLGSGTGARGGTSGLRMPGLSGVKGLGAGTSSTSPVAALRAGGAGAGSVGGMRAGGSGAGSVGGRVGPAFTGINPADKTLGAMQKGGAVGATAGAGAGTVGQQARGMGVGPMGMGRAGQQQQRGQSGGQHAYIAQEVSFTSLKDEEELARRRDDMFK